MSAWRLPSWVKLDAVIKFADEIEKDKWYDAKVIGIEGEGITLEDIDTDSPYMGMKFRTNDIEINDTKLYRANA